jgi:DNA-binding LacI/PurR family transcriptional regulator
LIAMENRRPVPRPTKPIAKAGRPGIVDVAVLAGVSHITVSRVINNHPQVRPGTRERVLSALRELGYQPNSAARALVTGRSRTIGVVCYNTALYGPAAALLGLEQAAGESGFFVNIIGLKTLGRTAVEEAVSRLRQQAVAGGVIVSPQSVMADAFEHLPSDVPTVAIWGYTGTPVPVVASGEAKGAVEATSHLLGLGHRNVWHLAGPQGRIGAEDRIRGWRETLEAAGIVPPQLLFGDWSARSGYAAGKMLAADRSVTAIFAANDQMALGVMRALHQSGRSIPRDVSVVGFDDIPDAAYYTPPLTTIRQHFAELGRETMRLLADLMRGGASSIPRNVVLPAELIVRGSTAPPRS